ncbi:MAG TPA: hypothetical protein VGC04_05035 [Cellulomonas sp.]
MDTIGTPRHVRRTASGPRRWRTARLVLAGGVLLGVGAGMTSAAWTDGAWFTAGATTPTIQLQGGAGQSPSTWSNADTSAQAVTISATAFTNLAPGVVAQAHVGLMNVSTVPLIVAVPTPTWSGDFASGACALGASTTVTINGGSVPVTLAATTGKTTDVLVSVTPPASWNGASTCQNKSGTLTLTFTGSTS